MINSKILMCSSPVNILITLTLPNTVFLFSAYISLKHEIQSHRWKFYKKIGNFISEMKY